MSTSTEIPISNHTDSTPSSSTSETTPEIKVTLGTRKSNLALIQTELVRSLLRSLHPTPNYTFPIQTLQTLGDRNQTTPLHLLSPFSRNQPTKSLWTDELEALLQDGSLDLIVNCVKDVPTTIPDEFELGCMLEREDPSDALVVKEGLEYRSLEDLPEGSVVGTGSVRRVAQLKRAFPKLKFEDMRGNLNTRLAKLDNPTSPFAALILATSGLTRLGFAHRITCPLSAPTMMYAVGQGALTLEIRKGDTKLREMIRRLGHWETEWRCGAERALLRVLEGGCSLPVGVETELVEIPVRGGIVGASQDSDEVFAGESFNPITEESPLLHWSGLLDTSSKKISRKAKLSLNACVTSLDGTKQVLYSPSPVIVTSFQQAERFGEICAKEIKGRGGREILDEIELVRKERAEEDLKKGIQASLQAQ